MRRTSGPRPATSPLLALLAVFVLAAAASACGGDRSATSAAATRPEPSTKYTVAGDSISLGLGAALRTKTADDVVVKNIGAEGTGLARPDRFDWPGRLEQLAREFPPTVLVLSLGSNDAQDLTDGTGKVEARASDTAAWETEYARRLGAAFDAFRGTSTRVLWVGPVRTAEDRVGLTNRRIQRLAADAAAGRPWVTVTDLAEILGSGEQPAVRCLRDDGLHLTSECLDEAAAALVGRLQQLR